MTSDQILQLIIVVINVLLVPIVLWCLAQLSAWLKAKAAKTTSEDLHEFMDKTINRATGLVQTVVLGVKQSYVEALKKAGTWNEATAKIAYEEALKQCKAILQTQGMVDLNLAVGDAEAWLASMIEAQVGITKPEATPGA